jgi:hypothetical protein
VNLAVRRWLPLAFLLAVPMALLAAVVFQSATYLAVALLLVPIAVGTSLQLEAPLPSTAELPAIACGIAGIAAAVWALQTGDQAGFARTLLFLSALLGGMHTIALAYYRWRRRRVP